MKKGFVRAMLSFSMVVTSFLSINLFKKMYQLLIVQLM